MSGNNSRERLPSVRFRVRGWIDDETFGELLKFSDYLGRDGDEIRFVLNHAKAEKNNYDLREIILFLKNLGDRVDERALRYLEEYEEKSRSVELELEGSKVLVRPRVFLGEYAKQLQGLLKYDRARKVFWASLGALPILREKLESLGLSVVDKIGLPEAQPLPNKLSFKGQLRDYQKEALEAWRSSGYRGIIALPTGAGKTLVAIAAMAMLSERTLVVVYTKEQLWQWIEKILELTDAPKAFVAGFYGEEKRLAPITVSTYQTAFRNVEDLGLRFSFLVVDEVHHLPAEKFKTIALNMYSPRRMGLSATVVREDGKHVELFPLMGGVIYHKGAQELAQWGYLAPYVTKLIRVDLTKEEREKFENLKRAYRALVGEIPFKELVTRAQRGDPIASRALKIHSEMLQLVQRSRAKLEALTKIVNEELSRGSKILVFTQYVDQAEELGRMLNACVLTGEMDQKTRRKVLDEFKSAPSGVLVLTSVGDEGLDIPDVDVGIIVAGTGSRRQFIQRLGRLLRPKPGKIARLYEIVTRGTGEESQARRRKRALLDEVLEGAPDRGVD
ncbi:MAG: DEAD/DEAH box helicase [Fervidicoccaceae archaeon]